MRRSSHRRRTVSDAALADGADTVNRTILAVRTAETSRYDPFRTRSSSMVEPSGSLSSGRFSMTACTSKNAMRRPRAGLVITVANACKRRGQPRPRPRRGGPGQKENAGSRGRARAVRAAAMKALPGLRCRTRRRRRRRPPPRPRPEKSTGLPRRKAAAGRTACRIPSRPRQGKAGAAVHSAGDRPKAGGMQLKGKSGLRPEAEGARHAECGRHAEFDPFSPPRPLAGDALFPTSPSPTPRGASTSEAAGRSRPFPPRWMPAQRQAPAGAAAQGNAERDHGGRGRWRGGGSCRGWKGPPGTGRIPSLRTCPAPGRAAARRAGGGRRAYS